MPYLNAFPGVVPPAKKALKKAPKQAPKLTLATLMPLAAPPAGSTCFINNTRAHSRTASVAPKTSAANKRRKPSASPPLGLPKPG